jgi:hypothetical protein
VFGVGGWWLEEAKKSMKEFGKVTVPTSSFLPRHRWKRDLQKTRENLMSESIMRLLVFTFVLLSATIFATARIPLSPRVTSPLRDNRIHRTLGMGESIVARCS